MGKSYNSRGYLCCDECGKGEGQTRNIRCPFGYCYSPALCPTCAKKLHWHSKKTHVDMGCDVKQAQYLAERQHEQQLIESGDSVRCSASNWSKHINEAGLPSGWVQVIFRTKSDDIAYFMSGEAYDAIPLGKVATPSMYQEFSQLIPAPNRFK